MTVPCAICAGGNSLQYQQGVASGGMAVPVGEYLGFKHKGQSTLSSGQKPQPLAGMETCVYCTAFLHPLAAVGHTQFQGSRS